MQREGERIHLSGAKQKVKQNEINCHVWLFAGRSG